MKIWEKYLLRETLKVFFLFLGCFYFLYALIDYSTHMQDFMDDKRIQISHLLTYYCFQFIKRANLLVPLALLISTIKVLLSSNAHGELIALQASGVSLKKIIRPFFLLAGVCTLFNLVCFEFWLPSSLNSLDLFKEQYFKHYESGKRKERVHVIYLKDQSKILYQTHDKENKLYFDAFWICSSDDIWRMKYLSTDLSNPVASYVDHIQRNAQGHLEKTQSFEKHRFAPFKEQPNLTGKGYTPLENRKASTLFRMLVQKDKATAYEYPQAMTQFLFKCIMPFFSFLVVIAAIPFCIRHSRTQPVFFIYAFALFGFVLFFALIDASLILGENNTIPPITAVSIPFLLCGLLFGWKLKKNSSF